MESNHQNNSDSIFITNDETTPLQPEYDHHTISGMHWNPYSSDPYFPDPYSPNR